MTKLLQSIWLATTILFCLLGGFSLWNTFSSTQSAYLESIEREDRLRTTLLAQQMRPHLNQLAEAINHSSNIPSQRLNHPAGQQLLATINRHALNDKQIDVALYDQQGKILFSNKPFALDKTVTSKALDRSLNGEKVAHQLKLMVSDANGEPVEQTWVATYQPLEPAIGPFVALSVERNHTDAINAFLDRNRRSLIREAIGFGVFYLAMMVALSLILQKFRRSEERQETLQKQLRQHTYYDQVTGLPNRQNFVDRLEYHFQLAAEGNRHGLFAVLLTDLDSFKVINESLGHKAGNQLLYEVGQRISRCVGKNDMVSRLGGDEFGLIINNIDEVTEAIQIAKCIHSEFEQPFDINGHRVSETISIGIAVSQGQNQTAEELIRDADIAMGRAKINGRGQYELFNVEMHQQAVNRIEMENNIRHSLEEGEFFNRYHPIVDLKTGVTTSLEALVRWSHPVRGELAPNYFIPLAEEIDIIESLDQQVLDRALCDLASWKQQLPGTMTLSVNVNHSAQHFHGRAALETIINSLVKYGLSGHDLKLELTESSILRNDLVASALFGELRKMGVKLCMDDFGTGFSSLSYLHKLRFDMLKIDMSFVTEMPYSEEARKIVHSIIEMGSHLGLSVTAEGVETEEQLNMLKEMGCRYVQGYYFAKPLLASEVPDFIRQQLKQRDALVSDQD
ncbi:MAG: putative bifunctional diguanylate cyclase/phosphodiesterase [Pseudomonadota bacterium]